jgi:hypothetical protein
MSAFLNAKIIRINSLDALDKIDNTENLEKLHMDVNGDVDVSK